MHKSFLESVGKYKVSNLRCLFRNLKEMQKGLELFVLIKFYLIEITFLKINNKLIIFYQKLLISKFK